MAEESPKRILVVDDEPTICRILTDLLTLDGHAVHIATTPGDAIELCRMRHFDLVFLDYYLPEMTGDKLVGIIKRTNPRQTVDHRSSLANNSPGKPDQNGAFGR